MESPIDFHPISSNNIFSIGWSNVNFDFGELFVNVVQNISQLGGRLERSVALISQPLGGEFNQYSTKGVDVRGCRLRLLHLHIEQLSDQYEFRWRWFLFVHNVSRIGRMPTSLWPCWSRCFRPDAFGWSIWLFRPEIYCHWSRLGCMSYCFYLKPDDEYILHHLLPQGKVFAVELSDFNSCSGYWSHIFSRNEILTDLVFFFQLPLLLLGFLYFIDAWRKIALIPLDVMSAHAEACI